MKHYTDHDFGARGEKLAARYLKREGYKILIKNYKIKQGEIDIVAREGEDLVFIEVKTRSAAPYLSGMYAVDTRKQEHIFRTASMYMEEHRTQLRPRFDIIEVELDRETGKLIKLNHLKAAFTQRGSYSRY